MKETKLQSGKTPEKMVFLLLHNLVIYRLHNGQLSKTSLSHHAVGVDAPQA